MKSSLFFSFLQHPGAKNGVRGATRENISYSSRFFDATTGATTPMGAAVNKLAGHIPPDLGGPARDKPSSRKAWRWQSEEWRALHALSVLQTFVERGREPRARVGSAEPRSMKHQRQEPSEIEVD